MKTLAFLDCPTGISGDMCLGAVVGAGVPLPDLQAHIDQLQLPEPVMLQARVVRKNGIAATKVDVVLPPMAAGATPPVRHLSDIEQLLQAASLPARVKTWSLAIFRRLAIAEGAIHGIDPQRVHFHEVGATDAIVDIVGTCLGLDWLGVDEVYCAPLPTGRGMVRAAHGFLPVPAPAVLKLMEMAQVPVYNTGLQGELVTPTGAAIATELATRFGDPPTLQLRKVGLGAGHKDLPLPNILRLWLGQVPIEMAPASMQAAVPGPPTSSPPSSHHHHHPHPHPPAPPPTSLQPPEGASAPEDRPISPPVGAAAQPLLPDKGCPDSAAHPRGPSVEVPMMPVEEREQRAGLETVVVLETQVDDLSPQAIGYLYDRLLQAGALDVFTQGITMKKSRPGHLITVIAYPEQADCCDRLLLQETTTLGVRRLTQTRHRLRREIVSLETPLGSLRLKLAFAPDQEAVPLKVHPEYEDCAALARHHHLPWRVVYQQALATWYHHHPLDRKDDNLDPIAAEEQV